MIGEVQKINQLAQLADMLKALGQPLRIQIMMIIVKERIVSIPTLQDNLPGIDQFLLYSNLRYMHKKQLVKKLRKGRDVYYGLSEKALSAEFDTFFQNRSGDKAGFAHDRPSSGKTHVFA